MPRARGKVAMHVSRAVTTAIPSRALDDLNWMRALAAVAVLADHVRGAFFVDFPPRPTPLVRAVYLLAGLGQQAVIVFFVLSGFFIGTSVAVTSRDRTWSWPRFILRRFTRLYVVLLPALALTAAWDTVGTALFGLKGIYIARIDAPLEAFPDLRASLRLDVLLGNAAFLQDLFVPAFGSNGPLWSLSYEFWAYLTFPLLFRAAFGDSSPLLRALSGLLGVSLLVFLGGKFPFYFSVWALGALLAIGFSYRRLATQNPLVSLVATAIFTMALLVAHARVTHPQPLEDFALAAATALFIAVRLAAAGADTESEDALSRAYSRWGDVFAGFSYTLYATHYPVVAFLQTWLVGEHRWTPSLAHAAFATVLGVAVMALYAFPLSRLTEARTDDVRRWLGRRGLSPTRST